jgi:hypothetical protein
MISTPESQVTLLESVVKASQGQECPAPPIVEPILPPPTPDYILHLFSLNHTKVFHANSWRRVGLLCLLT